jgi:NitT/TauT family transport system permease protein
MRLEDSTKYRLAGLFSFLAAWEITGIFYSDKILPSFINTFVTMIARLMDGTFLVHGLDTIIRVYTGFAVAAILGISLGLVVGWSPRTRAFFDFLIDFLRNVSSITLIPITVLLIGIGFNQKIVVITYAAFFPVVLNTIAGVSSTEKSRIEAARTMGATDWQVMKDVVFYSALPSIFTGLRLSMGVAFVVVIAAELVGATSGLGYYLHEASRTYEISNMFAAALFVSILGYASNKGIVIAGERIISWKDNTFTGV